LEQAEKLALTCCPAAQLSADEPGRSTGNGIGLILPFFYVPADCWVEDPNARSQQPGCHTVFILADRRPSQRGRAKVYAQNVVLRQGAVVTHFSILLTSQFGEGTNYSSVRERRLPGFFSVSFRRTVSVNP
jgi:hypothetical protein